MAVAAYLPWIARLAHRLLPCFTRLGKMALHSQGQSFRRNRLVKKISGAGLVSCANLFRRRLSGDHRHEHSWGDAWNGVGQHV